ncbi:MAG: spore germination protein [Symbiobacterium sp.]|uniref:spore germination protein n=1 Tax=Symbiobacterium sp. TaxID=1971213 RepID=UPI003464052B
MTVEFHIHMIKVNGIESSSAFTIGTNLLIGFGSQSKSLSGGNSITGDSGRAPNLFSAIDDRDYIDTPFWQVSPGVGDPGIDLA